MIAELLELLFQGHEMTGNAMTWTLGELLAHPEVLGRLRRDLAATATWRAPISPICRTWRPWFTKGCGGVPPTS